MIVSTEASNIMQKIKKKTPNLEIQRKIIRRRCEISANGALYSLLDGFDFRSGHIFEMIKI